jgi:4-hydroxybenzoate polyprenyltransferase
MATAAHFVPTVAVTAFGTALGAVAGLSAGRVTLLAAALLTGQLSIGWLNDLSDAGRDSTADRLEKPLAAGLVSRRVVRTGVAVAAVACVALSLALGWLPGVLHLVAVGSAWGYNLWLKFTPLSWVPFLISFALLPAVAATTAGRGPDAAVVVAAGLLGVAAHFANTVADARADRLTGVRGMPQRLGPALSRVVAAGGVVVACGVLLVAPELGFGPALSLTATALLAAASVAGAMSALVPVRHAFDAVMGAAALALAGVVASALG